MQKYYSIFNQYIKKFDFKDKMIRSKFHHTYRVSEFCKEIAESLKLNEEDTRLAIIIGLLHDIARFEQWTKYKTFVDSKSVDHGNLACDILLQDDFIKKFTEDQSEINIILKALKNHNKKDIEKLDDRTTLFCKIIRDADKLDIAREQCNEIKEEKIELNKEILNQIYDKKLCSNHLVKNSVDSILRILSFTFDYNFKYSYNFLLDENIISKKFDLLEIYGQKEEITKLKKFILKEMKERC